jgi:UDP-N-acetylmuramoylalanine--D-glutamate ligase
MVDVHEQYKGKKITVMGLGVLGRAVGDAEYFAECGAEVTVTDMKSETQLGPSIQRLKKFPNVKFVLGGHNTDDFIHTDMVLKAAGVPLNSPYIDAAVEAGVHIVMSTALAAREAQKAGAIIVGITGTRGKSTTTHMIYHVLHSLGKRAHLGGNVRGVSTLALLPHVQNGDVLVLELDSWQLQGFGDLRVSPDIAVFTNLMLDHQNYYPTMEEYFEDKACIFRFQKEGNVLIAGNEIVKKIIASHPPILPVVPPPLPDDMHLSVLGEHNRENASLARLALHALHLSYEKIDEQLADFQAVDGRLQYIEEKRGVKIYNDNNATTPEATVAALHALKEHKGKIVLLAGGSDKGLPFGELAAEVLTHCKAVVLLRGTGTDHLKHMIPDAVLAETLTDGVNLAFQKAGKGDVILFSPACASFGMFSNEYERNDEFIRLINEKPN